MANVRRLLNAFAQFNLVQPSGGDLRAVPLFAVKAANISVIKSPAEFYSTLKDLAEKSEKRISLSSLYLGTGKLERELVASLAATKSRVSDLDLTVLLDYNRATRETPPPPMIADKVTGEPLTRSFSSSSSKSLLLPLVKQGAKVNFYLTLNLGGLWKRWIQRTPKWNELSSLHHMKLYIFDDHLVISGANLGDTYFTTRQDRYVLLRDCPALCDYFDELIRTVSRFSMSLQEDGSFRLHPSWRYDPRKGGLWHRRNFRREAVKSIRELNERFCLRGRKEEDLIADKSTVDTVVFPLLQLGTLGVADEEAFTSSLLRSCCAEAAQQQCRLHIGTGYFNLTRAYQSTLLGSKRTTTEKTPTTTDNKNSTTTSTTTTTSTSTTTSIVMASEEANGFHGGAGILRFIPLVYTHYVRSFLQRIQQQQQNPNIALWYYSKPGWSFHAKGIWLFPCSSQSNSSLTVIGSTNFGYRSVRRDNEAAIVLVSRDQGLRRRLEEEHQALIDCSRRVTDPKGDLPVVPLWVATIATLFRSYF